MRLEKRKYERWWVAAQNEACPNCSVQMVLVGLDCTHCNREKATITPYSGCVLVHYGWLCPTCRAVWIAVKPFDGKDAFLASEDCHETTER